MGLTLLEEFLSTEALRMAMKRRVSYWHWPAIPVCDSSLIPNDQVQCQLSRPISK